MPLLSLSSSSFPQIQSNQPPTAPTPPFISEKMRDIIEQIIFGSATNLDLSFTYFNHDDITALAWALTSPNCELESLNLTGNMIGDTGAEIIANVLTSPNCKLESLSLLGNTITDTGAEKIANALTSPNCKLKTLNLDFNNISDTGAEIIANALTSLNCKLESLSLIENLIGDTGIQAIAKALITNSTFKQLDIDNPTSELTQLLKRNQENAEKKETDLVSLLLSKV